MSEIKSKKALEYIHEYIPWAYMTLAIKTIQIAEQEAEERHAKEIDFYLKELKRCRSIFESIRDTGLKLTTGNVSHHKAHVVGMASRMVDMINQKLTEK